MSSRRMPSLLALRAFEAAARRLSFTEAGRELHVSQAAISRHVRGMEAQLECPLFRRLHRRVELTTTGERLANELTDGFSRIYRAAENARGLATKPLRLAVEPAFAARWLVPRLGGFSLAHPEIELQVEASDEFRVLGRDADIAIRFLSTTTRRPRGRAKKLLPLSGFPVVAPQCLARAPRADTDVLHYRLLHDDDGTAWRLWFASAGLPHDDRLRHLHLNDASLAVTAALRGQGTALSAPLYIDADLKAGRLRRLGQTEVTFGDYWLLEATGRAVAKARSAFLKWLDSEVAG
jgi:LysR family glycine cleavage system transcriptional activator